jgi:hypothetical protein
VEKPENDVTKPRIEPNPTLGEREALEEALARLLEPPSEPRTAWWRRGVDEGLEGPEFELER